MIKVRLAGIREDGVRLIRLESDGDVMYMTIAEYDQFATELESKAREAWPDKFEKDDEPYFGWCDVDGCGKEGCSGGNVWRETGYWIACNEHSKQYREGKPQPKMKQKSIDREASRLPDGTLPIDGSTDAILKDDKLNRERQIPIGSRTR